MKGSLGAEYGYELTWGTIDESDRYDLFPDDFVSSSILHVVKLLPNFDIRMLIIAEKFASVQTELIDCIDDLHEHQLDYPSRFAHALEHIAGAIAFHLNFIDESRNVAHGYARVVDVGHPELSGFCFQAGVITPENELCVVKNASDNVNLHYRACIQRDVNAISMIEAAVANGATVYRTDNT
jgi:hypothetical protein